VLVEKVSLPLQAPVGLSGQQASNWYRERSFVVRPVVLITTMNSEGTPNAAVKTNFMTVSSMRYYAFSCSLEHHTYQNIMETGEFVINVPTEALLFAHEESIIDIDVAKVKAKKDEYLTLAQGVHVVKPDAPITIEILGHGWEREGSKLLGGDYLPNILQQYDNYASYLVSYQGFRENYPEPPTAGGPAETMTYIAIGIAIAVSLVTAIFIRKRFKKPTR